MGKDKDDNGDADRELNESARELGAKDADDLRRKLDDEK